jgi:hypothetical protein
MNSKQKINFSKLKIKKPYIYIYIYITLEILSTINLMVGAIYNEFDLIKK